MVTLTDGRRPVGVPDAPSARRSRRPGWRSPRLVLGFLLVAASVLLGSWALATSDDTVGVWAVTRDLPEGARLARTDLEVRQLRFPDGETADRYVSAAHQAPTGTRLGRDLSAGELLPRGALAQGAGPDLVEVPVSVAVEDLPATVQQGARVDVWVSPDVAATDAARIKARRVLADVVVVAVPRGGDSLAPQTNRQVIVGVPPERAPELGTALGAMSDGRVVIARVG